MTFLRFMLALAPIVAGISALPSSPSPISSPHLTPRSVTCLAVGTTATATWTNSAGQTCTYSAVVGSNFGENLAGGEYVNIEFLESFFLHTLWWFLLTC